MKKFDSGKYSVAFGFIFNQLISNFLDWLNPSAFAIEYTVRITLPSAFPKNWAHFHKNWRIRRIKNTLENNNFKDTKTYKPSGNLVYNSDFIDALKNPLKK